MSIAVLSEVYDETRRLAIAGSGLASGDFRLQKLVPPLKKAGEKAPVFAKVAEAINHLVQSDAKSASAALLELSTLVTAILYTQGQTGSEGDLRPIETVEFDMPTANSGARVLKPLIEALTTTGSGRLEIIEDALNRGAFKDLRLVKPAVAAIDDVYSEIGDFVAENVLPLYGKAILPELRESFDIKGRGGHVRRLRLMYELDAEGTRELVETALESGSKEMKVAAIACLKDSKGHLSYVLEQTRAKAKEVRQAAFGAIARFTDKEVVDSLIKALSGGDADLVAGAVSENRSPQLLDHLLRESEKQLGDLLTIKDKTKLTKTLPKFHQLLAGFASRDDKKSERFLIRCFDQREAIAKLTGTAIDGEAVNVRIAALIVRSNSKPAQKAIVDAHETLPANSLRWALLAAMRTQAPKQVYKSFSPYYAAVAVKKRGRNVVKERQDVIRDTLCEVAFGPLYRRRHHRPDDVVYPDDAEFAALADSVKFDTRWLDAAVESDDLTTVCALAKPKHKGAIGFLGKTMDQRLAKSGEADYERTEVLDTMIRIGHPQTVDYFLKALEKEGTRKTRYYYTWWLIRLISDLPKSAVPRIEALLPRLNERVVDEVIPHLEGLKAK